MKICLLLLSAILIPACIPLSVMAGQTIVIDDFEYGLKPQWEAREFKRMTEYTVTEMEGSRVLKAWSKASASALIYRYKYDLKQFPILAWKWRVENTITKGNESKKEGDDYAARVYVIFPNWLPPLTKSINYIWANRLPKGNHIPNPFYSKAVMLAVESGNEYVGKWIMEKRNVYEDYKTLFGEEPPLVGGIAVMTDTDNTGESATAYYDNIRIEQP